MLSRRNNFLPCLTGGKGVGRDIVARCNRTMTAIVGLNNIIVMHYYLTSHEHHCCTNTRQITLHNKSQFPTMCYTMHLSHDIITVDPHRI